MKTSSQLEKSILSLEGRSYPAYRDLKGRWDFGSYILNIEHVQSDPYASPSRLAIEIKHPGFPEHLYENKAARIALQDALIRQFGSHLKKLAGKQGKGGRIETARPSQEVIERSACRIHPEDGSLCFAITVGFPAAGRRILAQALKTVLCQQLPVVVSDSLIYRSLSLQDQQMLQDVYELTCDQQTIREYLQENHLLAFVADGSILPRESGASDRPMSGALPFVSPEEDRVTIDLPYGGKVSGMAIPEGITVIAGGGYHGKSTLLSALETGVNNHISGDGRELAITRGDAVKIRSEDGRPVHNEDISLFIRSLPTHHSVREFVSEDASGSTSQAANVLEALEAGSSLLLIDEDTSATNFMVRDDLMARVVQSDQEPIIPYSARIGALKDAGVSTILVAGSSGAFFDKANRVIQMKDYQPVDITEKARDIASEFPQTQPDEALPEEGFKARIPLPSSKGADDRIKVKATGTDTIVIAREPIDIRAQEQIVDSQQAAAIGQMLAYADRYLIDGEKTTREIADYFEEMLDRQGPGAFGRGFLAAPRRYELLGALNRRRSQQFSQQKD